MFNLIAGPCVIESEELVMRIAEHMKSITDELGIPYTFKASFDKANRTSFDSFRGLGIEEGLRILQKVKDTYGLPICTDIHEGWQAEKVAGVCDILMPPDRFAGCRGAYRENRAYQKGAVHGAMGYGGLCRKGQESGK